MASPMEAMMARHAQDGRVTWIGLRAERRAAVEAVESAEVSETGLSGDHGRAGKRAVTLIQAEHLPVIAALLGRSGIEPSDLRRNIVIEDLNLAALRNRRIQVGTAVLLIEGPCPPCSRMEETFGPGGYSAIRGHGGWYASVVSGGAIRLDDTAAPA